MYDETKTYLRSYKCKKARIANLRANIRRAEEDARKSGIRLDGLPRSGKISHPTEEAAFKLAQIRDKINATISELEAECHEIEVTVESISDPRSVQILTLRYFEYRSWEYISRKMYYSIPYVKKELHNKALELLEIEKKRRNTDGN